MYTPEDDVIGTTADGRTYQIAAKGVPVPMAEAQRLGLIKAPQQQGPTEIKAPTTTTTVPTALPAAVPVGAVVDAETPKQEQARKVRSDRE